MFSLFFFFFNQKTAYEMRISDWSSDVCSSDLRTGQAKRLQRIGKARSAISAQVIVGWRFHIGSARPHRHGRQADAVEADSGEPPLRAKRCSDARPRRARDFVAGHVKARDSG